MINFDYDCLAHCNAAYQWAQLCCFLLQQQDTHTHNKIHVGMQSHFICTIALSIIILSLCAVNDSKFLLFGCGDGRAEMKNSKFHPLLKQKATTTTIDDYENDDDGPWPKRQELRFTWFLIMLSLKYKYYSCKAICCCLMYFSYFYTFLRCLRRARERARVSEKWKLNSR